MWLPNSVTDKVDEVATIYYIDLAYTKRWNTYRRANELRLLTGWCWLSKHNKQYRYGFKSKTVAYRDAWYTLVIKSQSPLLTVRKRNETT